MMLHGKKILLGVTGSIAAYKAAFLTRLLVRAGAEVQVLMTPAATAFIAPLTLSTLSRRPVYSDISSESAWNNHVELGLWADAMIVAPATATTLAKMASGLCDSVVTATYLSARCPVFAAPAMDVDMWHHPATATNLRRLESHGVHLLPVGFGELASGLTGEGRMAEPEDIVRHLGNFFLQEADFAGKQALVTAGPTYEPLDPVRFIGNRSSGKMGVAVALELARRGATVVLLLGPSALDPAHPRLRVVRVETAAQMHEAALQHFPDCHMAVLAAAVADYRPATVATEKIKKKDATLHIALEKTPDIAAELGRMKQPGQVIAGFALETNDELEHARGKLVRKNFDFVVLNSLRDSGAGFGHDTNKVTFVYKDNKIRHFELKNKSGVATDIANALRELLANP